jgi:NAD(P)-dependent dehydrogenase (short-subunit alcohol dehydrogenase family)
VEEIAERLGGLDVLVNNAGVGAVGDLDETTEEDWLRLLDINVLGLVPTTKAALPHLRRSTSPAIVNITSIAATAGIPNRAAYSASKGAILSLTRAMAADWVSDQIRVNAVSPGTVATPWVDRLLDESENPEIEFAQLQRRQPHGRLVTPEEVAAAVYYLASSAAASISGASLPVDGGMQELRIPSPVGSIDTPSPEGPTRARALPGSLPRPQRTAGGR